MSLDKCSGKMLFGTGNGVNGSVVPFLGIQALSQNRIEIRHSPDLDYWLRVLVRGGKVVRLSNWRMMSSIRRGSKASTAVALLLCAQVFALIPLGASAQPVIHPRPSDFTTDAPGIVERPKPVDWSIATIESTMKRYPTAQDLGSW